MKVYRIENLEGKGPYHGLSKEEVFKWMDDLHDVRTSIHPLPHRDGKLGEFLRMHSSQGFVYGFRSLVQLQSWFTDSELRKLKELGFNVVEIEIFEGAVIEGNNQLILYQSSILKTTIVNENLEVA